MLIFKNVYKMKQDHNFQVSFLLVNQLMLLLSILKHKNSILYDYKKARQKIFDGLEIERLKKARSFKKNVLIINEF